MKIKEVLDYFGSRQKAANAAGVSLASLIKYIQDDNISFESQIKWYIASAGVLPLRIEDIIFSNSIPASNYLPKDFYENFSGDHSIFDQNLDKKNTQLATMRSILRALSSQSLSLKKLLEVDQVLHPKSKNDK